MELWIRSQDKTFLVKADNVAIDNDGLSIYTYTKKGCNDITYELGTYKTKKRALEILDEIQKIFKPQLTIKDSGKIIGSFENTIIREGATYELKELSTYVYEMPQE